MLASYNRTTIIGAQSVYLTPKDPIKNNNLYGKNSE